MKILKKVWKILWKLWGYSEIALRKIWWNEKCRSVLMKFEENCAEMNILNFGKINFTNMFSSFGIISCRNINVRKILEKLRWLPKTFKISKKSLEIIVMKVKINFNKHRKRFRVIFGKFRKICVVYLKKIS